MAYSKRLGPETPWISMEPDGSPDEPGIGMRAGMAAPGTTQIVLQGQGNLTVAAWGADKLLFPDTAVRNVFLTRSGDDLCILYGTDEVVTVTGQFAGAGVRDIGFGGGIVLAAADLAQLTLQGSDGDDQVTGLAADWSTNDAIFGLGGRDVITDSDGGIDFLDGGDGDDEVYYAELGHSTVMGGAGNDTLGIAFSANPDQPETPVNGSALMVGGKGDDWLRGGAGDDVYLFGLGDGNDSVGDLGGTDRIRFGPGIALADVTFTKQGTMLWIRVRDPASPADSAAAQGILVERWFGENVNRCIESFAFDDGTVLDTAQVTTLANIMRGTAAHDFLYTDDDIWRVEALAGNDIVDYLPVVPMYVDAGSGNDTILGAQIRAQEATVVGAWATTRLPGRPAGTSICSIGATATTPSGMHTATACPTAWCSGQGSHWPMSRSGATAMTSPSRSAAAAARRRTVSARCAGSGRERDSSSAWRSRTGAGSPPRR
ncbi:calcium-binding protein [Pseudoduganella plicata]|uniref:Haemolysin-type calcium binding-related domain-containing protein n=1 Tax=Pseudoduganella plicata TaxID=321984 RepID=A0ABX5S3L5_9BURK|nr:calcium-binding protein [Pseudoduganella plicata]QBQ34931.1 hypothetical protein E1742_01100 [Pseudoduganella plicata]